MFVGSCSGKIRAFEAKSGRVRWEYDVRQDGKQFAFHGDPLLLDNLVVFTCDNSWREEGVGHVYALTQSTGKLAWKHRESTGIPSDVVRLGPSVFAVTLKDDLLALDARTGQLRWRFGTGAEPEALDISASPAVCDNHVYFGGRNGRAYALRAGDGAIDWECDLGARICTRLIVRDGDLYVGTANDKLCRLNRHTGCVIGEVALAAQPCYAPAVTPDAVLVRAGGQSLLCLDRSLGLTRWRKEIEDRWTSKGPVVHGSEVLMGSNTGEVAGLSLDDGTPRWSRGLAGRIRCMGSSGDLLFAGTQEGMLYVWRSEP